MISRKSSNRSLREVRDEVHYRVVFKGYLEREQKQIEKMRHIDKIKIPDGL